MNKEKDYYFTEEEIPWAKLESVGITKELLEKADAMKQLLYGKRTDNLIYVKSQFLDKDISIPMKLQLRRNGDSVEPLGFPVQGDPKQMLKFTNEVFGYKLKDEDKEALLSTGNLGKQVELTSRGGKKYNAYISLDSKVNDIVVMPASIAFIPKQIAGKELTESEYKDLKSGKLVKLEGLSRTDNKTGEQRKFNTNAQFSAEQRNVVFISDEKITRRRLSYGLSEEVTKHTQTKKQGDNTQKVETVNKKRKPHQMKM